MHKHKMCLTILTAVAAATLLTLTGIFASQPVAVCLYLNFVLTPRELPERLIRPCFREVAKVELPQQVDDARALFHGGRDPGIFVKFRTNPDGIKYILDAFGGLRASPERVDLDEMRDLIRSGGHIFVVPSQWEKRLGVCLFDPGNIKSGRVLGGLGPSDTGGYKIFIDDRTNTVYIHAFNG